MNLKERIQDLCKKSNVSMNKVETDLGFGKGYISKLGKSTPNAIKIQKIADYFHVSLEFLMTGCEATEDPRIIERDTILENIEKVFKAKNWSLSCDTYDDDHFIIKNAAGQIITSLYDYELIARYKSLQKKGRVTADLLVPSKSAFFIYLESLGYYIGRDDPEHKPVIHYGNGAVIISDNMLDDMRTRIDTYAKATMDSAVLKLNEDSLRKKREEKERLTEYLLANAANARTDIDIPKGVDTSDDDIMDDENF